MSPLSQIFELNITGGAFEWSKCCWLAKLRWVILGALLLLMMPLFVSGILKAHNFIWLMGILSLAMILNLLWQLFLQNRIQVLNPTVIGFNLLGDLMILSAVIMGTGGVASPFFYSYILLASLAGVLIRVRYSWSYLVVLVCVVALFYLNYIYFDKRLLTTEMQIAWMFQTGVLCAAWFLFRSFGKVLETQVSKQVREIESFQVQEKLRSLGALAAGFSHEFASPLFTIKSSVERSIRQLDKGNLNDAKNSLAHSLLGVKDCEDVIHRMNAAQLDTQSWIAETVDLVLLVKQCVGSLDYQDKIVLNTPVDLQLILPRLQFVQIFINILDNADEVSPEITVKLELLQNHWVSLEISDVGSGFSAEVLQFLGEPFRSTKQHGTGLGLYLARLFCESMSGRLKVNSSSAGSVVLLQWPLQRSL